MDFLPAIDLRHGHVVRLEQGDSERSTVYQSDPFAVLEQLLAAGARWIHIVDLDAAFGESPQRELLSRLLTYNRTHRHSAAIELGGGLRDATTIEWALTAGCRRVILGSLAARDPQRFAQLAREFPNRLVPALEIDGERVRVAGWRSSVPIQWKDLASSLRGLPCPAVLVTDIARDGMMVGGNLELARQVAELAGIPALVSGGIRSTADVAAAAEVEGVGGVIVGRALYEGKLDLEAAIDAARGGSRSSNVTRRIIPCLDVEAGRVVKGVRFENLRDIGDPAACARKYESQGADEVVFLDITAASDDRETDLDWVRKVADELFVPMTIGGGVRTCEDARRLLRSGADKIALNTAALDRPPVLDELAREFGSQCVVISVDAKRQENGWQVVSHGGRVNRNRDVLAWLAESVERGAGEVLLTSIDSDGTGGGYDLELLTAAVEEVGVPVIASGGAGQLEHLAEALAAGAAAVLAASIFHDGIFEVAEVKQYLAERGFPMREVSR